MHRFSLRSLLASLASLACLVAPLSLRGAELPPFPEFQSLVNQYCADCHGPEEKQSGIDYHTFLTPADYQGNLEVLEGMAWVIEEHEMPPVKADKQPSDEEREKLIAWVQGTLLAMQNASPNDPGHVVMPRLTNAEFDRVIRDLTGQAIEASTLLPGEPVAGEGFTNVGQAQDISPARIEKYLDAAARVLAHARITPERGVVWHKVEPRKAATPRDARLALVDEWVILHRNQEDELFNFRKLEKESGLGLGWYLYAAWLYANRESLGMGSADAAFIAQGIEEKEGVRLVPRSIELTRDLLTTELEPVVMQEILAPFAELRPGPGFQLDDLKAAAKEAEKRMNQWMRVGIDSDGESFAHANIRSEKSNDTAAVVIDQRGGNQPFVSDLTIELSAGNQPGKQPMHELGVRIMDASTGNVIYDGSQPDAPESVQVGPGIYEFTLPDDTRGGGASVKIDKSTLTDAFAAVTVFNDVPEEMPEMKPWSKLIGNGEAFEEVSKVAWFGKNLGDRREYSGAQPLFLKHQNYIFFQNFDTIDLAYLNPEAWPGGQKGVPPEEADIPEKALKIEPKKPLVVDDASLRSAMTGEGRERLDRLTRELVMAAQKPHQDMVEFLVAQGVEDVVEGVLPDASIVRQWPANQQAQYRRLVEQMNQVEQALAARAREQLATFAETAWRESISQETVDGLLQIYLSKRGIGGSYEAAVKQGMKAVLLSPRFLYRLVSVEGDREREHLDQVEFADRMAAFLWASRPDERLLELARNGNLLDPETIETQMQRMLEDERANALATQFAGYWLGFAGFEGYTVPNPNKFPDYDQDLRNAMAREASLFFEDLFEQNRPVTAVYEADYTFLNERLADHYGIEGVRGDRFRKVQVDSSQRGGIFGMGALLTKTSTALRTSPVLRGVWILTSVMGHPVPEPPPGVPELSEEETNEEGLSITQQLAKHREDPACSSCHERIDPQGIALENFDAIGRWRSSYTGGVAVDASTRTSDGNTITGLEGLRDFVREHEEDFVRNFCRKLLGYAISRPVLLTDRPLIDEMMENLKRNDYRVQTAILTILKSPQFLQKRVSPQHPMAEQHGAHPSTYTASQSTP